MDAPIISDIRVLDNLLALNLNVSLWSGGVCISAGACQRTETKSDLWGKSRIEGTKKSPSLGVTRERGGILVA